MEVKNICSYRGTDSNHFLATARMRQSLQEKKNKMIQIETLAKNNSIRENRKEIKETLSHINYSDINNIWEISKKSYKKKQTKRKK